MDTAPLRIVRQPMRRSELALLAHQQFGDMVKAVVVEESPEEWIEYDSMINIRPTQGNRSRGVDDPRLRELIRGIVVSLVVD